MSYSIVFPGQGSQSVAMLSALAEDFTIVKETFTEASDIIKFDLWDVVSKGPSDKLNDTRVTQPAMLAAGIACWRVLQEHDIKRPQFLAGHSLGEYSALVAANSLQYKDAIQLVLKRAQFMQQAVPSGIGAMAAILGLENDVVINVCQQAAQGEIVSAVNFNSPGQIVIAGNKDAVDRAMSNAKDAGAKRAILLPVSVPSHCALMKPAAENLAQVLQDIEIKIPSIPVIHNVDVKQYNDIESIRAALINQLFSPVRWVETIESIATAGSHQIIECGPGKVLVGLIKRIDKSLSSVAFFEPEGLKKSQLLVANNSAKTG